MDTHSAAFFGFLLAIIHSLGALAAVHALLTVRTAQGAIAWAMSLFFIPYFTLIPYLVFGRSTFDEYIAARRQANREMQDAIAHLNWRPWVEEAMAAKASQAYAELRAMPRLGRMPCLANNAVGLLVNGEATFQRIFEAIREAQQVVLIQFFIIHDDLIGRRLQAALLEKAGQGVAVHLLFDRIGSHALPRHYVDTLRRAGVQVHAFAAGRAGLNRFQVNFRNHRKIVVVDGKIGFLGGHNVGDEYLGDRPPLSPWRDTHVWVTGPAVACLQESFAEDWFWAARELPPLLFPDAYPEEGALCQVLPTGPADPQETCALFFIEAINSAKRRLWITTPYFIPDEAVFAALRLAVMKNVDVRILMPSRPDHRIVYAASSLYASEAVRAGVRIFRYQPGFLHQKVVLIDDDISAIGSANLDNRSFRLNFEVMLLTVDTGFTAEVAAMLEQDFSEAVEMTVADSKNTHRLLKLGMRVARLISPVL